MIIVCGKPRSGTTSVAKALNELGYNTLHFCPLTNPNSPLGDFIENGDWCETLKRYDALVSWRLTPYIESIEIWFNIDKIIYCNRKSGWEASVEQFGFSKEQIEIINSEYKESFKRKPGLEIDISSGDGWKELCSFLDKKVPKTNFPNLNKSENNYAI